MPLEWGWTEQYNIPIVNRVDESEVDFKIEPVNFNEASRVKLEDRKKKTICCFLADYLIERTWTRPESTAMFVGDFGQVLSPDFSQYTDMPRAMRIWNHYRKMWVTKLWQDVGITVIPVASWSDEQSYDYCFEGMPKNSVIALSSVGVMRDKKALNLFYKGFEKMREILEPSKIIVYGKLPENVNYDIIQVDHIMNKRFNRLKPKETL